jgi:hypothetical protein
MRTKKYKKDFGREKRGFQIIRCIREKINREKLNIQGLMKYAKSG